MPAGVWAPGPNHNCPDRASYSWQIKAPNDDLALAAEVLATAGNEVLTYVDLKIYDQAAWKSAITRWRDTTGPASAGAARSARIPDRRLADGNQAPAGTGELPGIGSALERGASA